LSFSFITFVGGSGNTISSSAAAAAANYTFTDCTMNGLSAASNCCAFISSTTGLALGITFDRCTVLTTQSAVPINVSSATTASGAADFDLLVLIRNCLIICTATAVNVVATGAAAH